MNHQSNRKSPLSRLLASVILAVGICSACAQDEKWRDPAWQDAIWAQRGCNADARGQWFRDAKFGAFIHFGVYSELGGYWHGRQYDPAEQIIGLGERHLVIPLDEYRAEAAGDFNPANFNAKEWVSLIKAAGQKYVIVTTKHHDGFCMFNTATTSNNVVAATPFGRDVIKELADECQRQGIVFCPYYSIGDWTAAKVEAPGFKTYGDYLRAQLKELLGGNYGDIKMLWFDNYWYVDNQWQNDEAHTKELYAYVRSLSPNTLVNDRCGGGAASMDGDYTTPENQLKGSLQKRYFEVVMTDTADDNWGWVRTARNYRSPAELIQNLIDCTSKGGNFVLNTGPTASGEFTPEHKAILQVMGKWLATNGAAIYSTEPAPECEVSAQPGLKCYATKAGNNIYLEFIHWPDGGQPASITIHRKDFIEAGVLDSSLPAIQVQTMATNDATIFSISQPAKVDPYSTVVRLTFAGEK